MRDFEVQPAGHLVGMGSPWLSLVGDGWSWLWRE